MQGHAQEDIEYQGRTQQHIWHSDSDSRKFPQIQSVRNYLPTETLFSELTMRILIDRVACLAQFQSFFEPELV